MPHEFERRLVEALEEENIFRQLATVISTTSGERKIPVVASKGEASWLEEGQAIPESDDTFGQVTISAFKLGTLLKISEELLNDNAFDLEGYVVREFARRTGAREEEAFLVGDGISKPTGILAATGGAQLGVTTAAAANVSLEEVLDLFYSLKAPYRRNAAFLMNDSTVKAIRKLKDGNGQYLWQPSIKEATLYCDNCPEYETQEVRLSLFSKKNYLTRKKQILKALIQAGFTITARRYIGREDDTGYHHFSIDASKLYRWE